MTVFYNVDYWGIISDGRFVGVTAKHWPSCMLRGAVIQVIQINANPYACQKRLMTFLTMHKISFLDLLLPSGNCCLNWDVLTWIPLFNRMNLFLTEFARRLFSSFISQWTKPMLWQYLIIEIAWGICCCYRLLAEEECERERLDFYGLLRVLFVRACLRERREGSKVFSTFSCRDL